MILAKTLAPEILEAISIGPNISYLRNYTDLCETANLFETELDLMYAWKDTITQSNQLNAYRAFTKKYILLGPELDTNMLIFFRDKINGGPPDIINRINYELNNAFEKASKINNPSKKQVSDSNSIDNDNQFLNALAAAILTCLAPCNYLEPNSESVGTYARKQDVIRSDTSPLWDQTFEYMQAPIGMAVNSLNKISNHFAAEHAKLSMAVENIYRSGISLFFTKDRIAKEKADVAQGKPHLSTANLPFTSDLTVTYNAFNNTNIITNIVAKLLGDCYRISDFNRRFNYLDRSMNLGTPKDLYITVDNSGYRSKVDLHGKPEVVTPIIPSVKNLIPSQNSDTSYHQFNDGMNKNGNKGPYLSSDPLLRPSVVAPSNVSAPDSWKINQNTLKVTDPATNRSIGYVVGNNDYNTDKGVSYVAIDNNSPQPEIVLNRDQLEAIQRRDKKFILGNKVIVMYNGASITVNSTTKVSDVADLHNTNILLNPAAYKALNINIDNAQGDNSENAINTNGSLSIVAIDPNP